MITSMDIEIVKQRDFAYVRAKTVEGERWIRANMHRREFDVAIVINSEFADEIANMIRKDKLEVEVV